MKRGWLLVSALIPAAAIAQMTGEGVVANPRFPQTERLSETFFDNDADGGVVDDGNAGRTPGGLTNFPDIPKAEPLVETVFGIKIDDPYRWMERPDRRAEMEEWANAASLHTTSQLAELPGRSALFRELDAASRATDVYSDVRGAGGLLFYEKLGVGANAPVLMVRESGKDRVLLDPAAGTDEVTPRAITSYWPSPDGKYVAIHLSENGSETGAIRIYDVATGKPRADVLAPVWGEMPVGWLDDRTVVYSKVLNTKPGDNQLAGMASYVHVLGAPTAIDKLVLGVGAPANGFAVRPSEFPALYPDPSNGWTIALAGSSHADLPFAVGRVSDLKAGKPRWTTIAGDDGLVIARDIVGDTLYYLGTRGDPGGEIRMLDLKGEISPASSKVVIKSGGRIFVDMLLTLSGLYVGTQQTSGAEQLYFVRKGTSVAVEMTLPPSSSIRDAMTTADHRSITFAVTNYRQNATYYVATAGKVMPLGLSNGNPPGAEDRTVVEDEATSADGSKVPLTIVYTGTRRGPAPTIIDAYGSYGEIGAPRLVPSWLVWNRRGGVYAYCHTRGGGEKGSAWHYAGSKANKPRAFEDLVACGERMIALGYATSKTLGLFGASAGGLLVPPTALKRPDLFAAVVTRVGTVNATRMAYASGGVSQFTEMGDPATEAGFKALAGQDPTQLLGQSAGGTDYMFTIGLNDKRVDPWETAKLVAMMRAKWADRHLVLIRSDGKAGHFGGGRNQALEERADIFAFYLNRFGAPGFVK